MTCLFSRLSLLVFVLCGAALFAAPSTSYSIMKEAPSWEGVEWINLAPGQEGLEINDLKGQVIYLSFFQKW